MDGRDKPGHDVFGWRAFPFVVIPEGPPGPIRDRVKVEYSFLRAIPALRFASAGMTIWWESDRDSATDLAGMTAARPHTRHPRACPGDPRLPAAPKAWMAGPNPAMTALGSGTPKGRHPGRTGRSYPGSREGGALFSVRDPGSALRFGRDDDLWAAEDG